MNMFESEIRQSITTAIRDLFSDKDRFHRIDVDAVVTTITEHVLRFENFDSVNETNQYEVLYQLLGKAVAAAQGWKINCAEHIPKPSETQNNLDSYMEQTYGAAQ